MKMHPRIITYVAIAFTFSWSVAAFLILSLHHQAISPDRVEMIHNFVALGPALAAIITSTYYYGTDGLNKLLRSIRLKHLSGNALWYVLSPLLFFALGLMAYRLSMGEWFSFTQFFDERTTTHSEWILWLLPSISFAFFEEIGWRGFLLPHLQDRFTAWKSTIILSIIWALWHFPFFFYRFEFSLFISLGFFFGLFVGALILTSIYNAGKGALIPVITFHFLNNLCSSIEKEIVVAVLSVGFVFLAIYIYQRYGREDLSPLPRMKNYFINT